MDVVTLQTTNHDIAKSDFYVTDPFIPVADGTLILERPSFSLSKGQINVVREKFHSYLVI